jgi:hypothetical protein
MADAKPPPDGPHAPLGTTDEIRPFWERFRAGGVVHCPRDHGPLALAVDGAAGAYRFVCTPCGLASPWFESGPTGLHVRGVAQPGAPSGSGGGMADEGAER